MTSLSHNLPLASWQWFLPPQSTGASQIDWLFWMITWICVFFFVLIIGLMGWFMWEYRARPGYKAQHSPHHNNTLELAWSIIPLLLVIVIFYLGFTGFMDARNAPQDAYEINVVAKKWAWAFQYPGGVTSNELHVPLDTPVRLVMSSDDVLHSLYIPAFRVKMDCVPGKYTDLWFQATRATWDDNGDGVMDAIGEEAREFPEVQEILTETQVKAIEKAYLESTEKGADLEKQLMVEALGLDLFCTEYCGTNHSAMYAKVVVHEDGGFEDWWLQERDVTNVPADVAGEKVYKKYGCASCHSVAGIDNPVNGGPAFNKYYGTDVSYTEWKSGRAAGPDQTTKMDENYIRESILYPLAKVRKGYKGIMPSFQGQIKDEEILALIQYIKKINKVDYEADWSVLLPKEEGEAGAETPAEEEPAGAAAEEEPPAEEAAAEESAVEAEPAA